MEFKFCNSHIEKEKNKQVKLILIIFYVPQYKKYHFSM